MKLLVVGAGLIGGSIGLAAREAGWEVRIQDWGRGATQKAAEVTGLQEFHPGFEPEIAVVAVPPNAVAAVIADLVRLSPNCTVLDVASVKTEVQQDVETVCGQLVQYIPTHPMAGKETSGSASASYDLFVDRLWVITPLPYSAPEHLARAEALVQACRALVFEMSPGQHDETVARTSHVPQVLSTLLAASLTDLPVRDLQVSGQGLRDMTRIAGSNPDLWAEILLANGENVLEVLRHIDMSLNNLVSALAERDREAVRRVFMAGNAGKSAIPGKHGSESRVYSVVGIMIDDKPGQLSAIFSCAGEAGINIEDVRIDHALGKAVAVVELLVEPEVEEPLKHALTAAGWRLRTPASAD